MTSVIKSLDARQRHAGIADDERRLRSCHRKPRGFRFRREGDIEAAVGEHGADDAYEESTV